MKYDWKFKLGCVLKYKEGRRDFAPVSRIKEIKNSRYFAVRCPSPLSLELLGVCFRYSHSSPLDFGVLQLFLGPVCFWNLLHFLGSLLPKMRNVRFLRRSKLDRPNSLLQRLRLVVEALGKGIAQPPEPRGVDAGGRRPLPGNGGGRIWPRGPWTGA